MRKSSLKEKKRKCAKCGSSPADDASVRLHRFPQPSNANKSRCELWAKFCFPQEPWQSLKFQNRLFTEHKMLCDRHFKSTSFEHEKRLAKFSIPENIIQESSEPDNVVIKIEPNSDQDNSNLVVKTTVETRRQKLKRIAEQSAVRGETIEESPKVKQASKQKTQVDSPVERKIVLKETGVANNTDKLVKQIDETNDSSTQNIPHDEIDESFNQTSQDEIDESFNQTSKYSDCELYGKLLTKKLKTYEVYERNQLMFKIDGLLVEHPPGFEKSSQLYTVESTDKILEKVANNTKTSTIREVKLEYTDDDNSDNDVSSSPQPMKKMKKEPISSQVSSTSIISSSPSKPTAAAIEVEQPVNINRTIKNLPVTVESNVPKLLVKSNSQYPNQVVNVTSSVPNERIKITSIISQPFKILSNPKQPIKVVSNQFKPVAVSSIMSNKPVVTSSIPNKPVKVTSVLNPASELSVPSHLPLEITIPKNKMVSYTPGEFVQYTSQPKSKIMILKSKSSQYVPSAQPPILITVPKLRSLSRSPCDMNSLEQLSSIAVSHASKYQTNNLGKKNMEDVRTVVSHEVICGNNSNKNIVEKALKFANIEDELDRIGC